MDAGLDGDVAVTEPPPEILGGAGTGAAFCMDPGLGGDKGDGDDGGKNPEDWKGVLAEFHLHVLRSYAPIYIIYI